MSKRISYGKTFGPFYDLYRKFYRDYVAQGVSGEEVPQEFYNYFSHHFAQSLDDITSLNLFFKDMNREITHVYMKDAYLLPFLKTVEIKDLDGIKQYIKDNGDTVLVNTNNQMETITDGISFNICLHPPFMKQGYVIAYTLLTETNEMRLYVNHGAEQFHVSSIEIENKKSVVYTDQEINEITKLAINLLAYICCFPDCFVDGTPRDVKTDNNKYLNTSDKVLDVKEQSSTGIVNPHFRRGFFKHLTSDFYKNKKGQIVFVHETMVNGKAKTIE